VRWLRLTWAKQLHYAGGYVPLAYRGCGLAQLPFFTFLGAFVLYLLNRLNGKQPFSLFRGLNINVGSGARPFVIFLRHGDFIHFRCEPGDCFNLAADGASGSCCRTRHDWYIICTY